MTSSKSSTPSRTYGERGVVLGTVQKEGCVLVSYLTKCMLLECGWPEEAGTN